MPMRAYYGSRISPNQSMTPEGFLVCHNTRISRVGYYEYLGSEIGLQDEPNKVIQVYRSPEEVFSPAAIASFEGKVLTDEHPTDAVTPENATRYAKGTVTNVRQGSGDNSDFLLADLVVYDEALINEIQDGKREVSCGYDCVYVPIENGAYAQQQIRGNHVAVVTKGRGGNRVAIQDSKKSKEDVKPVGKTILPRKLPSVSQFMAAIGLKHFATDADPEDISDVMDAMTEERTKARDAEPEKEEKKAEDDAGDIEKIDALTAKVEALAAMVEKLVEGKTKDADPEAQIDAAIAELEKSTEDDDQEEEESHTIPAEQMDEAGPVAPEEDRPKDPITGDNAYKLQTLKAMKPIIAAISDPKEKRRATDAMMAALAQKPKSSVYKAMQKGQEKAARKAANDTQAQQKDYSDLGKQWAEKYNPHYKARKEV